VVIAEPVNTPTAWSERARLVPEPWLACGWSEEGQRVRLEAVADALDAQRCERLLDFGCGTGELCTLIPGDVLYVGFDSAPGMVTRARRDHAAAHRTFTAYHPTGRFDVVACVGPFNLIDHWSKERTWHAVRHLWDTTGCRALALSLYAGWDDRCLVYSEDECDGYGRSLSHDVKIERIRDNDLLMVARR
jgi:SAM-dependent methyltransferase